MIIIIIDQNTEKIPGDLRRLAVTQTSEKPSANDDVKNSQQCNNNFFAHIYILSGIQS